LRSLILGVVATAAFIDPRFGHGNGERFMRRREFLRSSAVVGTAAAAGSALWSRRASAAFGEVPAEYARVMLPESARAQSILEVFMYGGVSPWETFYASDEFGKKDSRWLYAFYDRTVEACAGCGYDTSEGNLLTPFAEDSAGKQVFLGPFLKPLLARPDVVERMRVVVNRHQLEPHEAAIPLAICGKTLGSPSMASLGTHVQRYFVDRDTSARGAPYSYGFATAGGFIPTDNVLSMVATGLHPGSARPLQELYRDIVKVQRIEEQYNSGCFATPLSADPVASATFVRDNPPSSDAGAAFSMFDVVKGSIALDDVTPIFTANLFAMMNKTYLGDRTADCCVEGSHGGQQRHRAGAGAASAGSGARAPAQCEGHDPDDACGGVAQGVRGDRLQPAFLVERRRCGRCRQCAGADTHLRRLRRAVCAARASPAVLRRRSGLPCRRTPHRYLSLDEKLPSTWRVGT
jgi:hypothetical protein